MSFAFTWVKYQNTTTTVDGETYFPIDTKDCPFLHFGNMAYNGGYSTKRVMGLRFIGVGAANISVWIDGYDDSVYADFWQHDGLNWRPTPQALIMGNADPDHDYVLKILPIPDPTDLTDYNSSPSTWTTLRTGENPTAIADCVLLEPNGEVYSEVFGLSLKTPTDHPPEITSITGDPFNVRNFRLMCAFDTTDGITP